MVFPSQRLCAQFPTSRRMRLAPGPCSQRARESSSRSLELRRLQAASPSACPCAHGRPAPATRHRSSTMRSDHRTRTAHRASGHFAPDHMVVASRRSFPGTIGCECLEIYASRDRANIRCDPLIAEAGNAHAVQPTLPNAPCGFSMRDRKAIDSGRLTM